MRALTIQGKPTMFVAADIADLRKHATLPPMAGNTEDMFRLAAAGQSSAGFGKLRAAARIQAGRRGRYSQPQAACCACRSPAS